MRLIVAAVTAALSVWLRPRSSANWGLHLIDMNLALGNLLDLVGQQAKAYTAESPDRRR